MEDWSAHAGREEKRYRDGEARLPDDADERQRQLTRMGNAAYGAGLAYLMLDDRGRAAEWFDLAVASYRASFEQAPPGSWGRPIAAMKARLLARQPAEKEARWALEAGADDAESPIGRYAAALAHLILGDDERARVHADAIRTRDDFPAAVGDALATIAAGTDAVGYVEAVEAVLASFETREAYLEDIPVADTVLVLQALAEWRGLRAELASELLPS